MSPALGRFVPAPTLGVVRTALAGLNLVASASFMGELYLLHHFGEPLQRVAVAAAALGALGTLAALSGRALARGLALLAALGSLLAGGLGFAVHLWRNHALAPEAPLLQALYGPLPALAPLALANVGLLIALVLSIPRGTAPRG